jgi:hypothetical protein
MRKKILIGLGVASLGLASFGGSASATYYQPHPSCFGGIHKTINTVGFGGFSNVGEVVQALGGQGKNSLARSLCAK